MTDDSTELSNAIAKDTALAEATTTPVMANTQNLQNQPTAHKQHLDTKPDVISSDCYIQGKAPNIEITDGKWKDVIIWRLKNVSGKTPNSVYTSDIPGLLPCNYLLGIPHAEDKYDDAYAPTYSGDYLGHYLWFKINKIKFSCKNFMVLVERDTSGGIQLLDDVVFEVRRIYNKSPGEINAGEPENLVTHTLSDLANGLGMDVPFTQIGYVSKEDLTYKQEISTGAVKNQYVGYFYLSHLIAPGNLEHALMLPTFPQWHYQLRAVNLPAGLSNVRVFLSYVWQLHTNVDAVGRNFKTVTMNLPYLGSKWADSGLEHEKKRVGKENIQVPEKKIKVHNDL